MSERRVCRAPGQHRSTQRKRPRGDDGEEWLTADIVELARQYGRHGYQKIAALLRSRAGWVVNDKRVDGIWRQEGPKVLQKQPKRGRPWLNDGSCARLRAERRNHVGSCDFVEGRTDLGAAFSTMLAAIHKAFDLQGHRISRPSLRIFRARAGSVWARPVT